MSDAAVGRDGRLSRIAAPALRPDDQALAVWRRSSVERWAHETGRLPKGEIAATAIDRFLSEYGF